jgi:putative SOS response-associated peptidase YedK
MKRMHKPDPKRPPHMQDKRAVVPIEFEDVDRWLFSTVDEVSQLVQLAPVDRFKAGPKGSTSAEPVLI